MKLKTLVLKSIFSSLIFLVITLCLSAQDSVWQKCPYCKTSKNAYFVNPSDRDFCIRADFKINAPIKNVVAAIIDYENYTKWIYNCSETALCTKTKDRVIYRQIISVPFPYKDSEAFLELKTSISEDGFIIVQNCIPDYKPLDVKYERITRYKSVWKITKTAENQTQIVWYAETGGPKGMSSIEKKMFLCFAPSKTIKNFTKHILSD